MNVARDTSVSTHVDADVSVEPEAQLNGASVSNGYKATDTVLTITSRVRRPVTLTPTTATTIQRLRDAVATQPLPRLQHK